MADTLFLVTIQDKETYQEVDIGACLVRANNENEARLVSNVDVILDDLRDRGLCRCVPHVTKVEEERWYKPSSLIRMLRREDV